MSSLYPASKKYTKSKRSYQIYSGPAKMTAAEKKQMKQMTDELGTRFCRRCDYCQPCQQEIPISMIMTFPTFVKRLPPDWYLKHSHPGRHGESRHLHRVRRMRGKLSLQAAHPGDA